MKASTPLRVGTRRSALAKTQTQWVVDQLEARGIACQIIEIVSEGDKDKSKPLYEIETSGPGLFTKQLELALQAHQIDLAVHSLKDLPTLQPPDLKVWAVPLREDPKDVLVCRRELLDTASPWGIRPGIRVGTSSLRREALLLSRADVHVQSVRGNVPTRVRAVESGELDAVVLAHAGLHRLQLQLPAGLSLHELNSSEFVSAPGQGALAIEGRADLPDSWREAVESLQHPLSAQEVKWERYVLRQLEGGCTLPLGVRFQVSSGVPSVVSKSWNCFVFLGIHSGLSEQKGALSSEGTVLQSTAVQSTSVPSTSGHAVSGQRHWTGFHFHCFSGDDPRRLAEEAISHFRPFLK